MLVPGSCALEASMATRTPDLTFYPSPRLARISHTGVFLGGNLCGGWSSGVKKAAVVG